MSREETFTFTAGPSQPKLYAWVHDYKTLGKDKLLGAGEIDVSSNLLVYALKLILLSRFGDIYNQARCHQLKSSANFEKARDTCD